MSRRKHLAVSDLFKSLGRWNNLYGRVIALNVLVFSAGQLHYSFKKSLSLKRQDFELYDCDGIKYTLVDKNVTFFLERKYGESGAKFSHYEHSLFVDVGELMGAFLLALIIRAKTSFHLAIGALYILCPGVHLLKSKLFVRASLFFSGVFVRMIRIPTMIHCMETLPKHLRIYGITIMFLTALVFNMWFRFLLKFVSFSVFWSHSTVAAIIVISCLLHVRFAPPSIMDTLFKLKTVTLRQALKGWVPKGRLINIDDLVDYVLYRGPMFSSEMSTLAHLSRLSVFTRKAVICVLLLPLNTLLLAGANSYEGKHIPTGEYENGVISDVLLLFGYVLAVIVYLKFGRRCTIAVAMVSAIISQVTMLGTRMEIYNACWKSNMPRGWQMTVARVAYAVTTISAGVITIMARLALFEHVPTSARAIVAMSFLFSTFFLISYNEVVKWTPLSEIYPNGIIIYPLGFTLLVAPFSLFIDNSSYLPINSSEIPAYSVPNRGYPMDQKPSDEPSEHLSVRMMQDACAAVELTALSISMEKDY